MTVQELGLYVDVFMPSQLGERIVAITSPPKVMGGYVFALSSKMNSEASHAIRAVENGSNCHFQVSQNSLATQLR